MKIWKSAGLLPFTVLALTSCLTQAEVQFVEDCPDPDDCGPGYHQAAAATSDDSAAFNVIVTDATVNRARLMQLGTEYAQRHRDLRVIVAFFTEEAGQERNAMELGMFPEDPGDEPMPPLVADQWLATLDFPAGSEVPASIQVSGLVSP